MTQSEVDSGLFTAWVLLTNQGVRWHYTGDGVPQLHPGIDAELGGGVRSLAYAQLQGRSTHQQLVLPLAGQSVDLDFFAFGAAGAFYGFGFAGSYQPENLRWYEFIRKHD